MAASGICVPFHVHSRREIEKEALAITWACDKFSILQNKTKDFIVAIVSTLPATSDRLVELSSTL